ncbi:response regulator [Chitinibacter bivalviorum]|uniref:Sensory/regulatory protein RpfC n=1 Tax=Chitinibacter bivalviorum TaxID=2739434 RepID=A0A7H9BMA2_9NEIS|nr:response regulator [Chitinibacter bivalviorum]QLG89767.1 response regulator [Chitinibacter bivalviorum]
MDHKSNPAILDRITKLVYRSTVPGQIICMLTALVLAAAHFEHVEPWVLCSWIAATWLAACWRLIAARQYFAIKDQAEVDYPYWNRRFATGVNVSGLIWGLGGYVLMNGASDSLRLFTAFVLSGLVAGAVPILGAQYTALRNFALLILTPVLITALLGKGQLDPVLAAMCILYMVVVTKGVKNYNDAILESVLLELEQKQLVVELEKARNIAEAASRAKSEFIANVSHEIRTPMNGIVGMTHMLAQSPLNENQRQELAVIQSSSSLLLALVNDVLDLSKIEAGKIESNITSFNLSELLLNTVKMFAVSAKEKGITLSLEPPAATPIYVAGDFLRLQQVLVNLIGNAIKFTKQGQVTVNCRHEDNHYFFSVSDSGIGISADHLSHIFDAFVQADGSSSRQFGGTGLGLTISQKIVKHLGGELQVSSEAGKGATFSFAIPLQPALEADDQVEINHATLKPLSILLVEDNPTNRLVASKILEVAGHQVYTAENGAQAVAMVQAQGFDVILMDVQMPVMDGLEAARQIRLQEHHHRTPIIALTANALEGDRQACFAAGMDDFITKPVRPEQLHAAIQAAIQVA